MILSEARELTQERLKELLDYDPLTGIFVRKIRAGHCHPGQIAGSLAKTGYWVIRIDNAIHLAHRLAWLFLYGVWPKADLDHKNRNPIDNRIENLRPANQSQNQANCIRRKSNGFKGVYFCRDGRPNPWCAKTRKNGKNIGLGHFATELEAHRSYAEGAKKIHGEYARP